MYTIYHKLSPPSLYLIIYVIYFIYHKLYSPPPCSAYLTVYYRSWADRRCLPSYCDNFLNGPFIIHNKLIVWRFHYSCDWSWIFKKIIGVDATKFMNNQILESAIFTPVCNFPNKYFTPRFFIYGSNKRPCIMEHKIQRHVIKQKQYLLSSLCCWPIFFKRHQDSRVSGAYIGQVCFSNSRAIVRWPTCNEVPLVYIAKIGWC